MLLPDEVMALLPQFDGTPEEGESTVLNATIEFRTEIVPSGGPDDGTPTRRPPPLVVRGPPSLFAIVESTTVAVFVAPEPSEEHALLVPPHQLKIPPPSSEALPAIVELLTVSVAAVPVAGFGPKFWIAPESLVLVPPVPLPEMSEWVTVMVPPSLEMPAPDPEPV